MKISLKKRFLLWKKKLKLSWKFKFAHHPICERFDDHIWKIGDMYVCQGCTMVYSGVILGFFLFLFNFNQFIGGMLDWFLSVLIFMLPTFLIEKLRIKTRWVKRSVRFLNGIALGATMAFLFVDTSIWERISVIAFIYIGLLLFRFIRRYKKEEDECEGCPQAKKDEVCEGFKMQFEANKKLGKYTTDLVYDEIKDNMVGKYQLTSKYSFKTSMEEFKKKGRGPTPEEGNLNDGLPQGVWAVLPSHLKESSHSHKKDKETPAKSAKPNIMKQIKSKIKGNDSEKEDKNNGKNHATYEFVG